MLTWTIQQTLHEEHLSRLWLTQHFQE